MINKLRPEKIDIAHWSQQLQSLVKPVHHIPGRLRLKFNNRLLALLGQKKIAQINAYCNEKGPLYHYEFNPQTGSLIIEYDSQAVSAHLIDQLFDKDEKKAQKALKQLVLVAQIHMDEGDN